MQKNTIKNICNKNVCTDLLSRHIYTYIYVDNMYKTCATATYIMFILYLYHTIRTYTNKHSFIFAVKAYRTHSMVNG